MESFKHCVYILQQLLYISLLACYAHPLLQENNFSQQNFVLNENNV